MNASMSMSFFRPSKACLVNPVFKLFELFELLLKVVFFNLFPKGHQNSFCIPFDTRQLFVVFQI